jgi:large subunit ribosomal protein L15
MPLQRRLPKFGFKNPFRKSFVAINVGALSPFTAGQVVDLESLRERGLLRQELDGVKILGGGDLKHALVVKAHRFSASAKAKIEKAGGKAEVI